MFKLKFTALALVTAALAFAAFANLESPPPPRPITLATPGDFKLDASLKLSPGPDDAPIARITARFLQQVNYRRQKFDDNVSSNFLARYISDLDSQHLHFTQKDVEEFSRYNTTLDELTLRYGDTAPGYEIFTRFLDRLKERTAYAKELLQKEKFDFTADERFPANRHALPYPADLAEARKLWRDRLRFEYLQEKLNAETPDKKSAKDKAGKKDLATQSKTAGDSAVTNAVVKPKTPAEIHDDIVKKLSHRYDRILKMFVEWDGDDVLQFYLTTLAHIYDPHSDYFGRAQFEDFSMGMNLSLFGIGALLTTDEDGYCKFKELKPGPAAKSGQIKEGDRIIAVAQGTNEPVDVVEMPLNKVVRLIRGPKDTEVTLTIVPADTATAASRKIITLVRDEIKLEDQEAKAQVIELPGDPKTPHRLGLIRLPSFYATVDNGAGHDQATTRSTTTDVTKLLIKLAQEKVDGLILDLRRNGGGSLEEAIRLTGLFIKDGPVVQVREPSGNSQIKADGDPAQIYTGPLFVLTDRYTASASEIVAGALQDYGRALIIGDALTHGKGTVQTLQQLDPYLHGALYTTNDPGAIKVTIQKFYRPSGLSTQLKGVVPDIILPSVDNLREDIGETAAENALPWDTIAAADYEPLGQIAPYVAELRQRSTQRLATTKDFDYINEDIGLYKKFEADKTISLNEATRLKEIQEIEARAKSREKERAARKTPEPKIYEFTLKQAELPGLPPPLAKTNAVAAGKTEVKKSDDEADDEKPAAVDPLLNEAEKIFVDYLNLLKNRPAVAAGK